MKRRSIPARLAGIVRSRVRAAVVLATALAVTLGVQAQTTAPVKPANPPGEGVKAPRLEAKAIALLRAMSSRLQQAESLAFTSVATYESPSSVGPPLDYATRSEVLLQRPDRLRVVTLGDGPASEIYYDGKTLTAYAPAENLVAVASAPSTIDAMLQHAFVEAAIYFPFADVVGSDPFKVLAEGASKAFYIGQSKVVGGTTADMVAIANDALFMQIWIGADDKLPRKMVAVYRGDPLRLRHQVELSDWKLDPVIAAEAFTALNAADARKIAFATPNTPRPAKRTAAKSPSLPH
jgi:hypothetical protein